MLHISEKKLDVFFADINKSESDFSPTTMYEDYAVTDRLFHWQSQSQTSETSSVGQRYVALPIAHDKAKPFAGMSEAVRLVMVNQPRRIRL